MSLGAVFDAQYTNRIWDAEAGSGPGSIPRFCRPYVSFVRLLLNNGGPWEVVDWGCGDGRVAEVILTGCPAGTKYCLYDVSPIALEKAAQRLGQHWARFTMDFRQEPPVIKPHHIVLVKDVLMHLSRAEINRVLEQVGKAALLVFCHDDPADNKHPVPRDIACGGYRPISLSTEGSTPYFEFTFFSYHVMKIVEVFRAGEGLTLVKP